MLMERVLTYSAYPPDFVEPEQTVLKIISG
jgi:hypothetical protein